MPDTKITALTEDTAPATTDLLATVDDPAGTPVTKKATIANVVQAVVGAISAFGKTLIDDADAAAARTTLGLGTADSPQFTGINVGHASDTTLARLSAGDLSVEGNRIMRIGGTDLPVADGGTGASTASAARLNLGIQVAEVSTGSIAAGSSATVTVTWGTAWADTAYDVFPAVFLNDTIQGPNLLVTAKTTTTASVRVYNNAAAAKTFSLVCLGIR